MTLMEFLHAIRRGSQKNLVLATLYYFKRYKDRAHMSVREIKAELRQARIPGAKDMNINGVINSSAPFVHSTGSKQDGLFVFEITGEGEKHVRQILNLKAPEPQVERDVSALESIATGISDQVVRGYIQEAITCLQAGALRAAIVFLWTGAVRSVQEAALAKGTSQLNAAIQKHDPKARTVTKIEDFAYIKDKTLLLTGGELGLLDKGERGTLEDALNLRNRCGHPTKYKPGLAKASSFIEDVVGVVWP